MAYAYFIPVSSLVTSKLWEFQKYNIPIIPLHHFTYTHTLSTHECHFGVCQTSIIITSSTRYIWCMFVNNKAIILCPFSICVLMIAKYQHLASTICPLGLAFLHTRKNKPFLSWATVRLSPSLSQSRDVQYLPTIN